MSGQNGTDSNKAIEHFAEGINGYHKSVTCTYRCGLLIWQSTDRQNCSELSTMNLGTFTTTLFWSFLICSVPDTL